MPGVIFGLLALIVVLPLAYRRLFSVRRKSRIDQRSDEGNVGTVLNGDAVFSHLTDGILTIDGNGLILSVNPAAQRILGRVAGQVVGMPVALMVPAIESILNDADDGRPAPPPQDCRITRRDGDTSTVKLSLGSLAVGDSLLRVVVLRDISEQSQTAKIDDLVKEIDRRVLLGHDLDSLIPFLCDRLIGAFGLRLAWLGGKEADGSISLHGYAGPEAIERYLSSRQNRWDGETPGPAARAMLSLETQQIDVSAPDWGDLLAPFDSAGLFAGISVPLHAGQVIFGALSVYAAAPLGDRVARCIEDLARRVGIALQVIRDQHRLRLQGVAIGAAANAIFITDGDGRIEWANDAFTHLSGYDLDEVLGQSPRLLRSGMQTADDYREMLGTIQAGDVWRGELVERRKDGGLYTVEQTVTPMRDARSNISHFVVVHEDITNRKRAEEQVRFLSSYDPMTELPNRSLFRERLLLALAKAAGAPNDRSDTSVQHLSERRSGETAVGVLFLDLDHFSRINDTMGHDLGDRVLKTLVERLISVTRSADTLARIGGDEFAVILDDSVGGEAAAILARRLLNAVGRPYDIDGQEIHLGASIGIALYPNDADDVDLLMKYADMAMYRAIHEAPNGYRFFSNTMNVEIQDRNGLERDLRGAVGREEFVLHYQPQSDVRTGAVIGMEALLRWNHPERGRVMPGTFIPLAEESGMIVSIGEMVLRLACKQIRDWQDAGYRVVPVAVNLSAVQLHREELVEEIQDIIADSGIDPQWIEIELTESSVMADVDAAERTLRALDEFGLKLAIDDFGTGYSSLGYLKRFPVRKLKIDQSFVKALGDADGNDAQIARTIIALGHSLNMLVVSEGVETEVQMDYLRRHQCDAVQGFLFSPPLPAEEAVRFLSKKADAVDAARLNESAS